MRAHDGRRKEVRCPALDPLAVERIIAVRGPDPVGALQDAIISASAAGGTTLYLKLWMTGANAVDQAV